MSDLGVSWRCSPGCPVAALNEQSGIRKSGDTPLKRNPDKFRDVYGDFKGQESCGFVREGSAGGASRFFFTSKASPEERWLYCKTCRVAERRTIFKKNADCPRHGSNPKTMDLGPIFGGTENPECLCWENAAEAHAQHEIVTHPTIKPVELMACMIRLVTPPKGIVLDPFIGTGTTAVACFREKFRCIGMEISEEYHTIAVARIQYEKSMVH